MCLLIWTVSQVSDVAHGPLVFFFLGGGGGNIANITQKQFLENRRMLDFGEQCFLQIFNSLFLKPLHRHWRRVRVWRCLRKIWRWGERRTRPSGPSRARWGWPSSPTSTPTSLSLSPARRIHSTLMTAESPTMLVSPVDCSTVQYWNIRHHAVQ